MSVAVSAAQRFTARQPCPICGGHAGLPNGRGIRCYGFMGSDGRYAHCTREDLAGNLELEFDSDTYAHRLDGPCLCGETHGEASFTTPPIARIIRPKPNQSNQGGRVYHDFREAGAVSAYDYRDELEDTLFQVWRFQEANGRKTFRQARPVNGGWALGISGVRRVLYRLPELCQADEDAAVLLCEGEKDVDRLAALGFIATTAPMGAGKWLPEYSESLRGRHVVVLLDNDDDGEKHGRIVSEALNGVAASRRLLRLPDLPPKGDVSDWLDAGGTPEDLERLIRDAASTSHQPNPNSAESRSAETSWPTLESAALHGLAGDVVRAIDPHTEGDPVAILGNFLVMFGSAIGRSPHVRVGATRHGVNEFIVHVGETSRARKGTAHHEVFRLFAIADPAWCTRVLGGLSSGEGLIHAVRDASYKLNRDGNEVLADAGVDDKRMLAVEPEFASVLRVASRDGSTLSELLRRGWDGDTLRTLTKNSPLVATAPHISLSGHITKTELLRELTETSQANGWANRHLFLCVRRSKLLPHGGALADAEVSHLARRVSLALSEARKRSELHRDAETNEMWEAVYPALTAERPGMLGAITARAEAHVLRLSLMYALLDGAAQIQRPHLEAALAVWQYCEDSARFVFGDSTGDPVADQILHALRQNGKLTQTQISELFGKNQKAGRLQQALATLLNAGLVRTWQAETVSGRAPTYWEATA